MFEFGAFGRVVSPREVTGMGQNLPFSLPAGNGRNAPESGHRIGGLGCPLLTHLGHYPGSKSLLGYRPLALSSANMGL